MARPYTSIPEVDRTELCKYNLPTSDIHCTAHKGGSIFVHIWYRGYKADLDHKEFNCATDAIVWLLRLRLEGYKVPPELIDKLKDW